MSEEDIRKRIEKIKKDINDFYFYTGLAVVSTAMVCGAVIAYKYLKN